MNASFGIDHPLIAVNDIAKVRLHLENMGFQMTPIGKHPWGTSTSLAMFEGCLIEIMGIYDDTLLDVNPAGSFHFGRHVHKHLMQREGVALSALHSTNIAQDLNRAKAAGLNISGTLEFGRDVTLPDGQQGRTKTTLALLPDEQFTRLSFFLCQQHRPDLIYVPKWMAHKNTVYTIAGITIVANHSEQGALLRKFEPVYGTAKKQEAGFSVDTANGRIQVSEPKAIEQRFGALPFNHRAHNEPAIIAMDFYCQSIETLETFLTHSNIAFIKAKTNPYQPQAKSLLLSDASLTGNTFFQFIEKQKP